MQRDGAARLLEFLAGDHTSHIGRDNAGQLQLGEGRVALEAELAYKHPRRNGQRRQRVLQRLRPRGHTPDHTDRQPDEVYPSHDGWIWQFRVDQLEPQPVRVYSARLSRVATDASARWQQRLRLDRHAAAAEHDKAADAAR